MVAGAVVDRRWQIGRKPLDAHPAPHSCAASTQRIPASASLMNFIARIVATRHRRDGRASLARLGRLCAGSHVNFEAGTVLVPVDQMVTQTGPVRHTGSTPRR